MTQTMLTSLQKALYSFIYGGVCLVVTVAAVAEHVPNSGGTQSAPTADGCDDLRAFDPEWQERLQDYLRRANALGIIVSLKVWDDYSITRGAGTAAIVIPSGKSDERVVCILTSHELKNPDATGKYHTGRERPPEPLLTGRLSWRAC